MSGVTSRVTDGSGIAAWVGDHAITVDELLRREAALRSGGLGSRLPMQHSPQGRNVRRWLVQLIATEQIVLAEAAARGLRASQRSGPTLGVRSALELGGVLAAVLATHPVAVDVRAAVTAEVAVAEATVRGYYDRNPDRFPGPHGFPAPYASVRAQVCSELLEHLRDVEFVGWIQRRQRALVRLSPGFEHPGDPHSADATHRH